ncbi:MAG: hypothetical protein M3082_20245 [Candidatus Dormibacteraeota bacterium]|nr:hypothetical protein [Candidatus Dormibacteraeota bacterium]
MPMTHPRTVRIGGLQISVTVDRLLAERVKSRLRPRDSQFHPYQNDEPTLNGTQLADIDWYHTIDLPNGIVTPGFVDHRGQVDQYGIPASLAGKRCLDVASFDGFWAFEMEKRGAAEVTGIDLHSLADCDYPTNFLGEYLRARPKTVKGLGFAYAKRALHSHVQRKLLSVYELSPEKIGTFDFVFMSDLLLHLREPLRALEAVWSVTRGEAIIADAYDAELEAAGADRALRFALSLDHYSGCLWWLPSVSALRSMLQVARFQDIEELGRFQLGTKAGVEVPKVVFRARHSAMVDA